MATLTPTPLPIQLDDDDDEKKEEICDEEEKMHSLEYKPYNETTIETFTQII
jgi:hypothetical protein